MHVAIALLAALLMASTALAQTVTDPNLTVTPVLAPAALYRIEGPDPGPIPVPGLPVAGIVMLGLLLGGAAATLLGRKPAPYAPA